MDVPVHCPVCLKARSFHPECFAGALIWVAYDRYDSPAEADLVRRLAPACYLCGTAKTEHAEHLVPRALGGPDTWTNMGGACAPCNRTKRALAITLDPIQQQRWDDQQATYRAAWSRITADLVAAELATITTAASGPFGSHQEFAAAVEEHASDWSHEDFEAIDLDDAVVIIFDAGGQLVVRHCEVQFEGLDA
ncbi:MAG TPA: HNH endonuclease [Pseudonocardiaceae bacterium]|nr:HNH endonuclease [Pseudonocardiaceae bacterium]